MRPEGESDLEKMDERVEHLFKFKIFYDQMDFSLEQRLVIARSSFSSPIHREAQASLKQIEGEQQI